MALGSAAMGERSRRTRAAACHLASPSRPKVEKMLARAVRRRSRSKRAMGSCCAGSERRRRKARMGDQRWSEGSGELMGKMARPGAGSAVVRDRTRVGILAAADEAARSASA
jgi:hypothetical protein